MNTPLLLAGMAILIITCVVILGYVGRDILRAMQGNLEESEDQAQRRTEKRKNERIRREIQQWRDGK